MTTDCYFLGIQSTYQTVEVVLYQGELLLEKRTIKKIDSSAALIPSLDQLLKNHRLLLRDISFIVVNQGPAPFTTLRVVIASVNGINFATSLPLIGIDGIEALLQEYYDSSLLPMVAILDAFANDVYYGILTDKKAIEKGCKPISVLLQELDTIYPDIMIHFLGNGVSLHKKMIQSMLKNRAHFKKPPVDTCSIEQIACMGLRKWKAQEDLSDQVLPLYLKKQWWQKRN